jgi:hypothetical protein
LAQYVWVEKHWNFFRWFYINAIHYFLKLIECYAILSFVFEVSLLYIAYHFVIYLGSYLLDHCSKFQKNWSFEVARLVVLDFFYDFHFFWHPFFFQVIVVICLKVYFQDFFLFEFFDVVTHPPLSPISVFFRISRSFHVMNLEIF